MGDVKKFDRFVAWAKKYHRHEAIRATASFEVYESNTKEKAIMEYLERNKGKNNE